MTIRYPRASERVALGSATFVIAYVTTFPVPAVVLRPNFEQGTRYQYVPLDHWLGKASWTGRHWTLEQLPLPFADDAA